MSKKSEKEEVRERGSQMKIEDKEYKLSDFDTHNNEVIEELKSAEYNDHEDMVVRMELTNREIGELLAAT